MGTSDIWAVLRKLSELGADELTNRLVHTFLLNENELPTSHLAALRAYQGFFVLNWQLALGLSPETTVALCGRWMDSKGHLSQMKLGPEKVNMQMDQGVFTSPLMMQPCERCGANIDEASAFEIELESVGLSTSFSLSEVVSSEFERSVLFIRQLMTERKRSAEEIVRGFDVANAILRQGLLRCRSLYSAPEEPSARISVVFHRADQGIADRLQSDIGKLRLGWRLEMVNVIEIEKFRQFLQGSTMFGEAIIVICSKDLGEAVEISQKELGRSFELALREVRIIPLLLERTVTESVPTVLIGRDVVDFTGHHVESHYLDSLQKLKIAVIRELGFGVQARDL